MAIDIDDWNNKYSKPKPSPSPTGIDAWKRATQAPGRDNAVVRRDKRKPPAIPNLLGFGTGGIGDFLSKINTELWNGANTRAKNVGKFWETGGGLWGKQNNSVVGPGPTDHEREVNSPGGYGQKWTRGFNPAGNFSALDTGSGLEQPRNFADILAEVQSMLQAQGAGGGVSYDPLREQARSQWQDADARTLAMYQQLQNSIGAEAGNLGKVYDEGVAATNAATEFANQQNAQSAQNIGSMVNQQAGALGIQEAVANDLNAGNLSGQDQMARTADTTARGQLTSNQLGSNKVSALDFNSDLVGAAGLQGAMDRGARSNELQRLLAGYDVAEQEANAQAQGSYASDSMDLAKFLYGQENENWQFGNNMQRYATGEANDRDYDLYRMSQASGKAPILNRNQAITKTLNDMGLPNIEQVTDRDAFMKIVRMYEGY
jgi:hypothetical protein